MGAGQRWRAAAAWHNNCGWLGGRLLASAALPCLNAVCAIFLVCAMQNEYKYLGVLLLDFLAAAHGYVKDAAIVQQVKEALGCVSPCS